MNPVRMLSGVKIPAAVTMAVVIGLALTGGVLAAKGGISGAQIPDADGQIHACYTPHKNANERQGKLRVVSDGSKCKKNEVAISFGAGAEVEAEGLVLPALLAPVELLNPASLNSEARSKASPMEHPGQGLS